MGTNEKSATMIQSPEEVDRGPSDAENLHQTENAEHESVNSPESIKTCDTSTDNESHESCYEDSSYVDSITSNDSKAALLKPTIDKEKEVNYNGVVAYTEVIYQRDSFYDMDFQHLDLDGARSRSGTMNGLLESPAYFDAMNCPTSDHRLIARVCRNAVLSMSQDIVPKLPPEIKVDLIETKEQNFHEVEDDTGDFSSIGRHMKNLFILGISVMLVNIAHSLRNLQSSINHEGGVGLYSLAASYIGFMVFSLFSPFIVQRFRPKRCLVIGIIPYILYVLANLHPTFFVLVPVTFLQGIGSALLWNAISTYTTYLARSYALQNDGRTVHVASQYFGIVFFFLQTSVVAGNLISSVVLMNGLDSNHTNIPMDNPKSLPYISRHNNSLYSNNIVQQLNVTDLSKSSTEVSESICGSRYCHSSQQSSNSGVDVSDDTKYVLFGIYGVSAIFALVVAAYLLDPLKPYRTTRATTKVVVKQLWSVLKCTVDKRFLLLFILFAYSNMQNAFVTGEITKAFVTCPVGIHMVGYTMICFGVCAGLTSYIGGYLNKHVGHLALITAAGVSNLVLLVGMSIWRPGQDQLIVCFILMGCWGLGDGIWFSQTSSLISEIFPDCIEDAFAAQRVLQGLGGAICFAYATSLCMMTKMFIMGVVCLLGLIFYVMQEILSRRQRENAENVEKAIIA